VLLLEGPDGFLARARRRLSSDDRRVFQRYERFLVRHERERAPGGPAPLVSVVTPVKDPPVSVLRALADSVLGQEGARVEWCLADDASSSAGVRAELDRLAARDRRVRLARLEASRGISGATNAALALATGELVAFVDHDDLLARDALAWMQRAFDDPGVGAAYSDEDKLDRDGTRRSPFLKPGWSPDLLLTCNYVSHFFVARHSLVREVGPLRSEFDGSQDYDLALRISERARLAHVPRVLYHWRMLPGSVAERAGAKPWAYEAARRALEAALLRRGERAQVERGPWLGSYRLRRSLDRTLDLTVVARRAGKRAVASWRARPFVREVKPVLDDPGELARAVREARGHVILVLDAELEPDPGALEELAAHALRPFVALVTPRVLSFDRRLESAGLTLGMGWARIAACPFRGRAEDDMGYFGLARATRDVSAVPSTAFAIERSKLEALGGLDPTIAPVHAGVELALRARGQGLRTIFACESVFRRRSTRSPRDLESPTVARASRERLGAALASEPHLSPHFRRGKERLEL
jgi:GT2 family glycosyltransferase